MTTLIFPLSRIEGHARVVMEEEDGKLLSAQFQAVELRGFRNFVVGTPAEQMPVIVPRICGVCSTAHHVASVKAVERVFEVTPPPLACQIREIFLSQAKRAHLPQLLSKTHPVDAYVDVDLYLPGCPPTPELFMGALLDPQGFKAASIVCAECGRRKLNDMKPDHLTGFQKVDQDPAICLVNQGFLCVGTSTRGGCRAPCTRAGHPCVGCRGPSNAFIEKESGVWMENIQRVFERMTDIPSDELNDALRSPQLSMFLFQFSDYAGGHRRIRSKDKVL